MVAMHPPFGKAEPKDKFYQYVGAKKFNDFWKKMQGGKKPGHFSEDFKDLVWKMISKDNRINMEGILDHKWMKGSTPSTAELLKEFTVRKKKADKALDEER